MSLRGLSVLEDPLILPIRDAPDAFELIVEPGAPELRALGVTHVLIVTPDPSQADALPGIERIFSRGRNHVYRVVGREPGGGGR